MFRRNHATAQELTQSVTLSELQRSTRIYEQAAAWRRIAVELEDDSRRAYEAALKAHRHTIAAS